MPSNSIKDGPQWSYLPVCEVPGCLSSTSTGKRHTQGVCDGCRKKFIKDARFRARLLRYGIIPD